MANIYNQGETNTQAHSHKRKKTYKLYTRTHTFNKLGKQTWTK